MSEATPDRTIAGLAPRARTGGVHPDASRLLARNRTAPGATQPPAVPRALHAAAQPQFEPEAAVEPAATAKQQVNASIPHDLRTRIRAAYRATSVAEGHRSFSDFVAAVLEAEAQRLEARYNDGQRFTGGEQNLPTGRPLGD